MDDIEKIFKIVVTALGAAIGAFLGNIDGLIITLLVIAVCDYVTGVAVAIANHELSSNIGFKGIAKKILMFAIVGIANLIDVHVLKQGSIVRTAAIFFYISNEGISLLENGSKLGLPIPEKLKAVLIQLKDKDSTQESKKPDTKDKLPGNGGKDD